MYRVKVVCILWTIYGADIRTEGGHLRVCEPYKRVFASKSLDLGSSVPERRYKIKD